MKDHSLAIVDGRNLPMPIVFANKVAADVFIKRNNKGVVGDDMVIIEATVIPKDTIPVLSIFTGLSFYVEFSVIEMGKLGNY